MAGRRRSYPPALDDTSAFRPGGQNVDYSLYKNWRLIENTKLQFRAEFFNLFNRPNFGQPQGISFTSLSSVVLTGRERGEIRSLRNLMRIIQFGAQIYFSKRLACEV
jgi:hypothetical protein